MKVDYRDENGNCAAMYIENILDCKGHLETRHQYCKYKTPVGTCLRPDSNAEKEDSLHLNGSLHGSVHNDLGEPKRVDKSKFRAEKEGSK